MVVHKPKAIWSCDLNDIASNVRGPWVVAGDFNAILCKKENCGGSRQALGCKKFGAWIWDCSMVDMGFVGS